MSTSVAIGGKAKFRVPGDWNALFGFGANILATFVAMLPIKLATNDPIQACSDVIRLEDEDQLG